MCLPFVLSILLSSIVSLHCLALGPVIDVYINVTGGKDCGECLNTTPIVCKSILCAAENITHSDMVEITIVSELLNLSTPVEFKNFSYLSVIGWKNPTVYCNDSSAGIAFVGVRNLTLKSLTIKNCGSPRDSTSVVSNKTLALNVAVYILNCTDVLINDVAIVESNGTGLSLYDTNGTVNIENSIFSNNSAKTGDGGGALHIEFTICTPGIVRNCRHHKTRNKYSVYIIRNCTFLKNNANDQEHINQFIPPSLSQVIPRLGKGGGIYLTISVDSAHNIFVFDNCKFDNNLASDGGSGMFVELLDSVQNNTILLKNISFSNNICLDFGSAGGGLVLAAMFYAKKRNHSNNTFSCSHCSFVNNTAYMGGGVAIYATKDLANSSVLTKIAFSMCNWTRNVAAMGAAVFATPGLWDYTKEGFLPVPQFTDSEFVSNTGVQKFHSLGKLNATSLGYGAVFCNEFKISFRGSIIFMDNKGSALYLSNSVLEVFEKCYITFSNNTAQNGGAVVMHGSSAIRTLKDSIISFSRNHALNRGGAMYVEFHAALEPAYHNCFVQSGGEKEYTKSSASFIFNKNYARDSGNSIFATTFRMCEALCTQPTSTESDPRKTLQCVANFNFSDYNNESLATLPNRFALSTTPPLRIIPGYEYHIPLYATDESNTTLDGIVYDAEVLSQNSSVCVDPAFSQVSNNTIRILGPIDQTAKLCLRANDVELALDLLLIDCQPGYLFNDSKCEPASSEYLGLVACGTEVCLKQGYWMGFCHHNHTKLCTASCPLGYCSYNGMKPDATVHPLPNDSSALDSGVCGPHRTGRLCSKCVSGNSAYFHSKYSLCGPQDLCHLGWLFYLLSEILPLTLLFVFIIYFNISFTSGKMNCFIFYIQILDSLAVNGGDSIKYLPSISKFHEAIMLIYHPLNLDFFILRSWSFCLWKGATDIDLLVIKYVTVAFALLLVLLTIMIARCRCAWVRIFTRFQTRKSVLVHGLTAFFVLCYSQATRMTFYILTYFCLYSSKWQCEVRVVYYAGYFNVFEGGHVKYATIALIVLIGMVIIPPLLLLLYPLMFKLLGVCKLSESRIVSILWKGIPIQLLDTFQSSFRENYRFFAGLYFLYRMAVVGAFAVTRTVLQFYSIAQFLLIIAMALHAVFQPYKERVHNIIDGLLLTNLAIINAISLYNYSDKFIVEKYGSNVVLNALGATQKFLMILPLLCVILAELIKFLKKWKNKRNDYESLPSLRRESLTKNW